MSVPGSASRPFVDASIGDPAASDAAAHTAARAWQLGEPERLRLGMNGLYLAGSTSGDVVLRVSRPTVPAVAALELAEFWTAHGLAVARPARDDVIESDGCSVTAWERLVAVDAPIDWRRVGAMVRAVHDTDPAVLPDAVPLPRAERFAWWDFDMMLADVDGLLDPAARAGIVAAIERHHGWPQTEDRVVCHGDIHPGNVVQTAHGPVLIDWDLLCWAPPGWDHGPLATWEERWGSDPGIFAAFTEGYGRSLADDPVTHALAELRLVAATLSRLRAGRTDEAAMAEAQRRLCYWRGDSDAPAWSAQ